MRSETTCDTETSRITLPTSRKSYSSRDDTDADTEAGAGSNSGYGPGYSSAHSKWKNSCVGRGEEESDQFILKTTTALGNNIEEAETTIDSSAEGSRKDEAECVNEGLLFPSLPPTKKATPTSQLPHPSLSPGVANYNLNPSPSSQSPTPHRRIHDAARVLDSELVVMLCHSNPRDALYRGKDGWFALHQIIAMGKRGGHVAEVVRALVKAYPEAVFARDETKGMTPLHYACRFRASAEVVKFLLHGAALTPEQSPHLLACNDGGDDASYGMEFSKKISVMTEAEKMERLCSLKCRRGRTALHYAMRYDAPESVVRLLLQCFPLAAIQIDKIHKTPLKLTWDDWASTIMGRRCVVRFLRSAPAVAQDVAVEQLTEKANRRDEARLILAEGEPNMYAISEELEEIDAIGEESEVQLFARPRTLEGLRARMETAHVTSSQLRRETVLNEQEKQAQAQEGEREGSRMYHLRMHHRILYDRFRISCALLRAAHIGLRLPQPLRRSSHQLREQWRQGDDSLPPCAPGSILHAAAAVSCHVHQSLWDVIRCVCGIEDEDGDPYGLLLARGCKGDEYERRTPLHEAISAHPCQIPACRIACPLSAMAAAAAEKMALVALGKTTSGEWRATAFHFASSSTAGAIIRDLVRLAPYAAGLPDHDGRLPLALALENVEHVLSWNGAHVWDEKEDHDKEKNNDDDDDDYLEGGEGVLQILAKLYPEALRRLDPGTGLYPFMLSAATTGRLSGGSRPGVAKVDSEDKSEEVAKKMMRMVRLSDTYELLRMCPEAVRYGL